jgi:hypothetical protein
MFVSTYTEVEICSKAGTHYAEVVICGDISTGGSNRYGSDEPEWIEVDNVEILRSNGKPLPRRVEAYIDTQHIDAIREQLMECDA